MCRHACVDECTAEGASLSTGAEQAKTQHDTLTARIREVKAAAATQDGEFGVGMQAAQSLKRRFATGKDRFNTAEAQTCETQEEMPGLPALVEGANWTVDGEREPGCRARPCKLLCVRYYIYTAV